MALRDIEQKIEGVVEKTFGRMFRSTLQPVELARRLARGGGRHGKERRQQHRAATAVLPDRMPLTGIDHSG